MNRWVCIHSLNKGNWYEQLPPQLFVFEMWVKWYIAAYDCFKMYLNKNIVKFMSFKNTLISLPNLKNSLYIHNVVH